MQEAFGVSHNAEFKPYSLPRLVACRLLAAAFYLSQRARLFVREASVLHFLNSDHVQRILLQDNLGPPEGRFRSPGFEAGASHVDCFAGPQY